jgi:hypothetical protein
MPLADIFQVIDLQRLPSGEGIENVYFFQRQGVAGNALDMAEAFDTVLRPSILATQSSALVHYLTRVTNLGDVADFTERSSAGVVGGRAGAVRNEWDCWAYTLRPSSRAVRPGHKRIGGVPEGDAEYTNGVVTDTSMLIILNGLRSALQSDVAGADDTYTPIILKRILDGLVYRLPETDGEVTAVPVAVCLLNNKISHQITRGNSR